MQQQPRCMFVQLNLLQFWHLGEEASNVDRQSLRCAGERDSSPGGKGGVASATTRSRIG